MSKDFGISLLMDFYGQMLTPKQLDALDFYYNNDFSLSEIAEEMNISRQGVRDFIKRGEKQLSDFEKKLGLAERFESVKDKIQEIDKLVDNLAKENVAGAELEKLKELTREVMNKM